ncbi:hypothetical protein [Hymenobacter armeniacus]|uniref:Gliding motility-associated protein GldM first immunoglobulin-like domain-containing protein n=1 Tax=Hymenobacter armeniacus TaxID=2771358 RepID=A0ABR8JRQ0_9BACT|nr:hypothetical protein [Hymenobacter armeniacus]MBD2721232.1 hypothetical protein [Hymenobacter armeniacus]
MIRRAVVLLAGVLALVATGLSFYWQHAQQACLNQELTLLSQQLNETNAEAAQRADYAVKFMRYAVEKNRYQNHEVAILAATEALRWRTITLLRKIHALRLAVLRAASSVDSLVQVRPGETTWIEQPRHTYQPAFDVLRRQLAIYGDSLHRLNSVDPTRLAVPSHSTGSPAMALAGLAQVENDLLAAEARTLQYLTQQVGRQEPRAKVVAVALVQSNQVAPGALYCARLLLIKSLLSPSIRMYCNEQPIPIDSDGAGIVGFTAPANTGPAEWHGTIRARLWGRDTTFQVRVPYRVVRR